MGLPRALDEFLELARKAINPKIEMADVREMIIQHVLTEDIFMRVFDEAEFHRENVIARKLQEVAGTFYHGETKRNIHARIAPYYETINARASQIQDHHEKQKFLKALYESFYKAYNPKAADRLGIVYTPDEIVRFMIESADYLLYKHFGKGLGDRGVEILDPATGTGTFITELIEYLPPGQLEYKYEHEIHCNEVSILPYYIASLNIEYTYKQKMGRFREFENICFVDTLDNMGFEHTGKQLNFFGITDENAERITRQNSRPIMLVIGNPPYSAWQENYNNQNANRQYPEIDQRIKETYIKQGTAQNQIGVYDMYTRFYRWATDRLDKNGIIAFITNSSYLNSRAFDGFRKMVENEFSHIYVVDLGGNIRNNPKLSGTTHNVFGIQTGVAIAFLVKADKRGKAPGQIFYTRRDEYELAKEKLDYLGSTKLSEIKFEHIHPDVRHNWLDITDNDWDILMPLIGRDMQTGKSVFDLYSRGNASQRDEWVYDFSRSKLENKIKYFVEIYQATLQDNSFAEKHSIKWDRELTKYLNQRIEKKFDHAKIYQSLYRPFTASYLYFDKHFNGMTYQLPGIFPIPGCENIAICVTDSGSAKPFMTLATDKLPDLHLVGAGASTQCLPFYRYLPRPDGSSSGPETGETNAGDLSGLQRVENITDWALGQFKKKYEGRMKNAERKDKNSSFIIQHSEITKPDIFHYVYAVLHHPAYRAKYEINLKREFPGIPFYEDFWQWADWGRRLMELHLGYETVEPYPLERLESNINSRIAKNGESDTRYSIPVTRLIARKEKGEIEVDTVTTLRGVPAEAWEYRLGTYSALEWILERYKEKKPKDPTIAEKFNTYRFADYKEQVIDLLGRVCTVSVETMKIVKEMP